MFLRLYIDNLNPFELEAEYLSSDRLVCFNFDLGNHGFAPFINHYMHHNNYLKGRRDC